MIRIVGLLGIVAFMLVSLIVGGRILLLAKRTRELPETTVGLSLVLAGGIGTALSVAPLLFQSIPEQTKYILFELSLAFNHIGYVLLLVFVWRVFRPNERWAAALFLVCAFALLSGATSMAVGLEPGQALPGSTARGGLDFWLSLTARFVAYGWATIESWRYHMMLKRRVRIGLANRAVADRFFYWAVCTTAVVVIWVNMAIQQIIETAHPYYAWVEVVTALFGFVVAGALWSAFFPSERRTSACEQSSPIADPDIV